MWFGRIFDSQVAISDRSQFVGILLQGAGELGLLEGVFVYVINHRSNL